jgi:hypothetical protein
MRFTLTFDGELPSNGDRKEKWDIRKQFHPQLEELWRTDHALKDAERNRIIPRNVLWSVAERYHGSDDYTNTSGWLNALSSVDKVDLCESITRGGRQFKPLVRETFALKCALKIVFLRKEEPGRVYQEGDLDNRLKTLFDALAVPDNQQVLDDPTLSDPICCLLEDDSLITRIDVDTRRLLSRPNSSQHEVHLLVEVDVRVTNARTYNQCFMGD